MLSATGAGGRPDVLLQGAYNSLSVTDWARDSDVLIFSTRTEKTKDDLWVLPMAGERKAAPLLQTPANERDAKFSPHGDWIAYGSDESGQPEVYVQHFPLNGSKFQISSGGAGLPQWSRDGRELLYRTVAGATVSVPVTAGATFQRGQATTLFDSQAMTGNFQPSADGKRFLATVVEGEGEARPLIVWTNWQATLRK
jgi:dipeptidyl aminopeptidase/acylaminoacyl peptidase